MLVALGLPVLIGVIDKRREVRLMIDPVVGVPFSDADEAELRRLLADATLRDDTVVTLDGCTIVRRTEQPGACDASDGRNGWTLRETTIDLSSVDPVGFQSTGTGEDGHRRLGITLPMTEKGRRDFRIRQEIAEAARRTHDGPGAATEAVTQRLGKDAYRNATLFHRCNGSTDLRYLAGDRRMVMRRGDPERLVDLLARYAKRFCPAD